MKTDIEFLEEMMERLEKAPNDPTQYEYVKEMIRDWLLELEEEEE